MSLDRGSDVHPASPSTASGPTGAGGNAGPALGEQAVPPPIFILGVSRRSGTNFLGALLERHPDCVGTGPPVLEDHLLRDADLLVEYAHRTSRRWPERWGERGPARDALLAQLGAGLASFLAARGAGRRVVARTPSTENATLLADVLPDAPAVVLLRDGRSVVASLTSGFRWSFRKACEEWARGADAVIELQRRPSRTAVLVVRYEDLVAAPERELRRILDACGLDADRYDFAAAASQPVIGSSFVRDAAGGLTWEPQARGADFAPVERFASWSARHRARFEHLAGARQRALGYSTDAPAHSPAWRAYNLACDLAVPAVRVRDALVGRVLRRRAERRRLGQPIADRQSS